jgi:hypothetical protein
MSIIIYKLLWTLPIEIRNILYDIGIQLLNINHPSSYISFIDTWRRQRRLVIHVKVILWRDVRWMNPFSVINNEAPENDRATMQALQQKIPLFGWAYQYGLSAVEQCFSLTANQPQPAYKQKNSLPHRANNSTFRILHTKQTVTISCMMISKGFLFEFWSTPSPWSNLSCLFSWH